MSMSLSMSTLDAIFQSGKEDYEPGYIRDAVQAFHRGGRLERPFPGDCRVITVKGKRYVALGSKKMLQAVYRIDQGDNLVPLERWSWPKAINKHYVGFAITRAEALERGQAIVTPDGKFAQLDEYLLDLSSKGRTK